MIIAYYVESGSGSVHKTDKTLSCMIHTSSFCLPNNYDKFQVPQQNGGGLIDVKVRFTVHQITHINDKDFTISMSTSILLYWNESRILNIMNSTLLEEHKYLFKPYIPLSYAWIEKLWLPDIYVDAMESAYETRIIQPFGSNIWIFLYS